MEVHSKTLGLNAVGLTYAIEVIEVHPHGSASSASSVTLILILLIMNVSKSASGFLFSTTSNVCSGSVFNLAGVS